MGWMKQRQPKGKNRESDPKRQTRGRKEVEPSPAALTLTQRPHGKLGVSAETQTLPKEGHPQGTPLDVSAVSGMGWRRGWDLRGAGSAGPERSGRVPSG